MVKLRNNQLPSSQQFLQKKDEGKTCARSCVAPLRENHNTGGRTLSNVDVGYGSNALIYDGKSNTEPPIFMKQINHCSFPNSPLVPLRLTYPDANTNSQMARVLHETSNSTKQNGEASPATQVAAAFHRWRYSHLKVSLYNELQKLQDLIVREARLHQEKVKEKEGGTNQEEIGSNASPFSTSLWRICNGLAHCLIEARNQILALAGNSEPTTCQKLATMSKVCKKSKHPSNKGSERTYQRTRFRFLKTESNCKEEKSSYKNLECESKQVAGDGEILEFVGAGKVM